MAFTLILFLIIDLSLLNGTYRNRGAYRLPYLSVLFEREEHQMWQYDHLVDLHFWFSVFVFWSVRAVWVNRKLSLFKKEQYSEATADLTTAEIETRPVPTSLIMFLVFILRFQLVLFSALLPFPFEEQVVCLVWGFSTLCPWLTEFYSIY